MKRLDHIARDASALEARTESPRTFSARLKTNVVIQRFHLWLPSLRISDAQNKIVFRLRASPMRCEALRRRAAHDINRRTFQGGLKLSLSLQGWSSTSRFRQRFRSIHQALFSFGRPVWSGSKLQPLPVIR